jgi:putative copper resistance protein D
VTLDWPLVARAANDASSLAWFGLALAPLYGGPRFASAQRIVGVLALLSLAGFATFTMMDIFGPGAPLSGGKIATVLWQTSFGHVWLLRGALCVGALALAFDTRANTVFTGLQLALLGVAGHAFARGGLPGAVSAALHVLAAGAWVGGAVALALQPRSDLLRSAGRFSKPGYAVASLAPVAGLATLSLIEGSVVPRFEADYGRLAATKIALFLALLALAAANRLFALPRGNILALRAGIVAELAVMAALSLTAAALASTSPESMGG